MNHAVKLTYILITLFMLAFFSGGQAQNKLTVNSEKPVFFDLKSLYRAGLSGEIKATGMHWLQYTTNTDENSPPIAITVQVAGGNIPEGLKLHVEAGEYIGVSKYPAGQAVGPTTVSDVPKVLIENIHTFFPEKGIDRGHPIRFSFEITDYSKIEPGTFNIYLLYTIIQ